MPSVSIVPIYRLDLAIAPYDWPFSRTRRDDIDAYFAKRRAAVPALWNGRVLLMHERDITGGTLRGLFFETAFADFMAWREWASGDRGIGGNVTNCFAMGALRGSDGAYLMGVMGSHTASGGRIYFPAGTPDRNDVRGEIVDFDRSVTREVAEETGLTARDYVVASDWNAVIAGPHLALMKRIDLPRPAEAVRETILRHLALEERPELADIRIVRSALDFDPMMPHFVTAYLSHVWREDGA